MKSNIKFESNVYPINANSSIFTDRQYISNVWDYNRLRGLKRMNSQIVFPTMQQRIYNESPVCSLNSGDPCWGMVNSQDGYSWVCMCTKTECRRFLECRRNNPYCDQEKELFSPQENTSDLYGYDKFSHAYHAFPIETDGQDAELYKSRYYSIAGNNDTLSKTAFIASLTKLLEQATDKISCLNPNDENSVHDSEEELKEKKELKERKKIRLPFKKDLAVNMFDSFKEVSQESIIYADAGTNTFIDAGPGTGKTYTLIQKLNYMVTKEDIDPEGILVLCFTNAAVDEIRLRLSKFVADGADRGLINVDVRTFHSFAWWLISQANELFSDMGWNPVNLMELSYDKSLEIATEIIRKYAGEVVGNWEHFIVDEVQDLTNTLARFVLNIIHACLTNNCGITILGDACQAIYDYTSEDVASPLTSDGFYNAVYEQLKGRSIFGYLTHNHRQGEGLSELATPLRKAILSKDISAMQKEAELLYANASLIDRTTIINGDDAFAKLLSRGSVCLMLRNNGQTLKLSSDLRKLGISHTLNITETKNNYALWIASIFADYSHKYIDKDDFELLLSGNEKLNANEIWQRLQTVTHSKNDSLNVRELLDSISVSKVDDPILREARSSNLIVSNIHRSKGREYDSVIVDQTFVEELSDQANDAGEYKTLYVAITRPKKNLFLSDFKTGGMKVIKIFDTKRKRWGKTKGRKLSYLEFDSSIDLDINRFAQIPIENFDVISLGDAVYLKRVLQGGNISYEIIHSDTGTLIGYISKSYIEDFVRYMQLTPNQYIEMPSKIDDLYVSGVYSQVVNSEYLDNNPNLKNNAPNGVWKWVELVGIGHAEYDVY